jgi:uncharacterized protein
VKKALSGYKNMNLAIYDKKIQQICQSQGITYLGLFGLYARGDNKPTSDVDLLVRFDKSVSLFQLARVQNTFSDVLSKNVDLVMEKNLKPRIRPYVKRDLITIYDNNGLLGNQ